MGVDFSFIVSPHIILWVINPLYCSDFQGCLILSETLQKETLKAISLRACEFMLTVRDARSLAFLPDF